MKILIVRLGALGDVLHSIPVAAALRSAFPDSIIHWLVTCRYRAAADLSTSVDRVIPVEAGGLVGVIQSMRHTRYDIAIDTQGLMKSALLARLSGARRVLGFTRSEVREWPASGLYTETVHPHPYHHVIQKNLNLLRGLGISTQRVRFPIRLQQSSGMRPGEPFGILHPGSSAVSKNWPVERFADLLRAITGRLGVPFLVGLGPNETGLANAFDSIASADVRILPPQSVGSLAALIRHASIFIGCDSGPSHLAAALGTPVVAVYGPTDPARTGPWGHQDGVVSRFPMCVCPWKRTCRKQERCIDDISVEEVFDVVRTKLEQ